MTLPRKIHQKLQADDLQSFLQQQNESEIRAYLKQPLMQIQSSVSLPSDAEPLVELQFFSPMHGAFLTGG